MSKRFGRNQKRKMLDELSSLQKSVVETTSQLVTRQQQLVSEKEFSHRIAKEASDLRSEIKLVHNILGEGHVASKPKNIFIDELPEHFEISPIDRLPAMSVGNMPMSATIERIPVHILAGSVSHHRLQREVHIYFRMGNADVAYGITEQGLLAHGREGAIRRIANEMADALVRDPRFPAQFK